MSTKKQEQTKVTRLCFTYVPVTNVSESTIWYEENLGFKRELVFESHAILQPDLYLVKSDGPILQSLTNGKPTPRTSYYCDNILELYKYLKTRGIKVEEIVEEQGCGWTLDVFDPDGNRITIWEAK